MLGWYEDLFVGLVDRNNLSLQLCLKVMSFSFIAEVLRS